VRKTVAQIVVLFTVFFVFAFGRAVLGVGGAAKVHRTAAAWGVWAAGIAFMLAASALAVLALRGRPPAVTGRATAWWCGGLWLLGLLLTIVYSSLVPLPAP
jgi:hypothetical protein